MGSRRRTWQSTCPDTANCQFVPPGRLRCAVQWRLVTGPSRPPPLRSLRPTTRACRHTYFHSSHPALLATPARTLLVVSVWLALTTDVPPVVKLGGFGLAPAGACGMFSVPRAWHASDAALTVRNGRRTTLNIRARNGFSARVTSSNIYTTLALQRPTPRHGPLSESRTTYTEGQFVALLL